MDLERSRVQVRRQPARTKKDGFTFTKPKRGKTRPVTLTAAAVVSLRTNNVAQNEERLNLAAALV